MGSVFWHGKRASLLHPANPLLMSTLTPPPVVVQWFYSLLFTRHLSVHELWPLKLTHFSFAWQHKPVMHRYILYVLYGKLCVGMWTCIYNPHICMSCVRAHWYVLCTRCYICFVLFATNIMSHGWCLFMWTHVLAHHANTFVILQFR